MDFEVRGPSLCALGAPQISTWQNQREGNTRAFTPTTSLSPWVGAQVGRPLTQRVGAQPGPQLVSPLGCPKAITDVPACCRNSCISSTLGPQDP